jgi:hypothetical protein
MCVFEELPARRREMVREREMEDGRWKMENWKRERWTKQKTF